MLVCKLRGIKELDKIIPPSLSGGAFAVYQQLGEADKANAAKIKAALLSAFGQDAFVAYEHFVGRVRAGGLRGFKHRQQGFSYSGDHRAPPVVA